MKVSFYGTRGSCPTPGANTVKYGGNTACTLIESDDGRHKLILDSGTGIRVLGDNLLHCDDIYLLLSHNHFDHIQGFPFFKPAYQKNKAIMIYPAITEPNQPYAITEQMNGSYFPVEPEMLTADIQFKFPDWSTQPLNINGFKVSRHKINHPNGGMAYLIEHNNKRVAYVTDNELKAINPQVNESDIQAFVHGVDLLIHDGQYVEADMPLKQGWGHSLISDSITFAQQAGVKCLAIYSHDPERTDDELDRWQESINQMNLPFDMLMSQEGQTISL